MARNLYLDDPSGRQVLGQGQVRRAALAGLLWVACLPLVAVADLDVKADLENVSGQDKTNWPVILTVYQVFGRNLPAGSVNPKGFRVFDDKGGEIPCAFEELPPNVHPGGGELSFVVPSMAKGAKATYRVTNTAADSVNMVKSIDLISSPHNLIADGGFEGGAEALAKVWQGQARLDGKVRHSGGAALLLEGRGRMTLAHAAKVPLHAGSWYYAGVWSKTENVARYGTAAGEGARFLITGLEQAYGTGVTIAPTCYTRDWNKLRLFGRYGLSRTDWGVERNVAPAATGELALQLGVDQKKQYTMDPAGDGAGRWWLDDLVLMEQPKVTARFDLLLEPLMRDGYFLFTRPTSAPTGEAAPKDPKAPKKGDPWIALPFPHEGFTELSRWGLKGQRVPFLIGVYHTRAMQKVMMTLQGGGLTGPDGARLPAESIEYSLGHTDDVPHHYLMDLSAPTDFPPSRGVRYLLATFLVPRDAKCGRYAGKLSITEAGKLLREVPVTLTVQDIQQFALKDRYIGCIFQAPNPLYTEETVRVYGRTGYSSITILGPFLKYKKGEDGLMHVDADDLGAKMGWAGKAGLAAVCDYSDVQLDDKPNGRPGKMVALARQEAAAKGGDKQQQASAEKAAYFRLIRELDAACKAHPDWPKFIHMNWDEPNAGDPKMGWTNECLPEALTTLDAGFSALPSCIRYYTLPCLDGPVDYSGPELYAWLRRNNKPFGIGIGTKRDEFARYQVGVLPAASGAVFIHGWHIQNYGLMSVETMPDKTTKPLRSVSLVGVGEGLDDLKAFLLLEDAIDKAKAGGDPGRKAAAELAEAFLKRTFSVWNGDHAQASANPPFFGLAMNWGYDRFYDDLQRDLVRHAAAVMGVKWVD